MLHHTTVACTVVACSGSTRWMGMMGRLLLAHIIVGEKASTGRRLLAHIIVGERASTGRRPPCGWWWLLLVFFFFFLPGGWLPMFLSVILFSSYSKMKSNITATINATGEKGRLSQLSLRYGSSAGVQFIFQLPSRLYLR